MPLPDKSFYQLPELMAAWGCGYSELHEYARTGALHFAVYLGGLGDYVERKSLPDGALLTTKHQHMQFVAPGYIHHDFAFLFDDDARRVLACDENQNVVVSVTSMDQINIVGPLRKTGHWSGKEVAKRELVVTAGERARFEMQHGLRPNDLGTATAAVDRILVICSRMHPVILELRRRYDHRELLINDEYDFHDLLRALLRLDFDFMADEEPTPSNAGSRARIDILIKDEKIAVELKRVNEGNKSKIAAQLYEDVRLYREHPSCRYLVCLVYDPEHLLKEPGNLQVDLTRNIDGLPVWVRVEPSLEKRN